MRSISNRVLNNFRHPVRFLTWATSQLSRETDAFLSTLPSSGTHWLRFLIAKGLVDAYDLDFEFSSIHPHDVVPPFRNKNVRFGFHDHEQVPLVQHSHKSYSFLYRGSRVVVLVRDLRDTMVSSYDTYSSRIDPSITFSEFLHADSVDETRHRTLRHRIEFLNRWYRNFDKLDDYMMVRYEDLKADTTETTEEVFEFVTIEGVTDELVKDAVEFSSLEHMKYIEEHGESNVEVLENDSTVETTDSEGRKINEGSTSRYGEYFDDDDIAYFQRVVEDELLHDFGYEY